MAQGRSYGISMWSHDKSLEGWRSLICSGYRVVRPLSGRVCWDKQRVSVSRPHPPPAKPFLISDGKNWLPVSSQNDPCAFGAVGFTSLWGRPELACQTSLLTYISNNSCSYKHRLLHSAQAWRIVTSGSPLCTSWIFITSFLCITKTCFTVIAQQLCWKHDCNCRSSVWVGFVE